MNPKTGGICGCLIGLEQPKPSHTCKDCGDPIPVGRTLCDFCLAKAAQPQSYPPSIARAATDAMKAAMIDSILLSVDNMTQQLGMMRNLLVAMKEADQ
jgi:predicted amidophosphoribosyltransferase